MPINDKDKVVAIIADAGGSIDSRTHLQKIFYLLHVTKMEDGFYFSEDSHARDPWSEDLEKAADCGRMFGDLHISEYPVGPARYDEKYTLQKPINVGADTIRHRFVKILAQAHFIDILLASIAVSLARNGWENPWEEVARRCPEFATSKHVRKAKELLRSLSSMPTQAPLPTIV